MKKSEILRFHAILYKEIALTSEVLGQVFAIITLLAILLGLETCWKATLLTSAIMVFSYLIFFQKSEELWNQFLKHKK